MNLGDIGIYIRERRRALSITLKDWAELFGTGINTLNKIDLGQANPMFSIRMGLFGKANASHSILSLACKMGLLIPLFMIINSSTY